MSDSHDNKAMVRTEGRMHPMVEAAMAAGPTPETLRELLAVQREWEQGEARKAYTRALVDLKRDLPAVIERDKVVAYKSTRYTHASLAAAVEAVTGILTQHGFTATWHPGTSERDVSVTCRLQHAEGHCEETTMTAPPDTSGHKNAAQAKMSTVTLLSRYTLLSMLGIATADMQDPKPREPDPEAGTKVDQRRNLGCAAWLTEQGKTTAEAERHIGRKLAEWTAADLANLLEWGRKTDAVDESTGAVAPEDEPPMREPGQEG